MVKRKSSKFSIMPKILILLLLALAIAGFAVFIKNYVGKVPDSAFHVNIDGKNIYSTSTGYVLSPQKALNVAVKSPSTSDNNGEYTVSIKADSSLKFTFVKDGKLCLFLSSDDVSNFFDVINTNNGFVLSAKGFTVTDMLKVLYGSDSISVEEQTIDYNQTMFWLTISPKDNAESAVRIGFSLFGIISISLDAKEIIF